MKSHVQSPLLIPSKRPESWRPESWPFRKKLGSLFVLEPQEDGSIKAVLSRQLQHRSNASYLGMLNSPSSFNAHKAIFGMLKMSEDLQKAGIIYPDDLPCPVLLPDGSIKRDVEREDLNTRLITYAFFIFTNLQAVFEPLRFTKNGDLLKAKKRAKKIMDEVIEKLAHPLPTKSDKREKAFLLPSLNCHVPLPFMAIEIARRLATEHQRLPSKSEVRDALISIDPELKSRRRDWSEVWQAAGLDSLPKGKAVFTKQKGQLKNVAAMSGKTARK